MFINFWFAAERSENLGTVPVKVRMLGQDFVLFRDAAGRAHCLANTCVHRGGSLGHGKLRDGRIECPYHGWQFDGDGRCVRIPSLGRDAAVPGRARVDAYPVEERYGLVFAFLGDLPGRGGLDLPALHVRVAGERFALRGKFTRCAPRAIRAQLWQSRGRGQRRAARSGQILCRETRPLGRRAHHRHQPALGGTRVSGPVPHLDLHQFLAARGCPRISVLYLHYAGGCAARETLSHPCP